jgi:ketosteroid isomerase-like protein
MTFRQTLDRHLRAIRERDLPALIDTLADGELTLIQSDGRRVRATQEFIELHRGWFTSTTWSLDVELVSLTETPEMGLAVFKLDYRDRPSDRPPIREASHLTLVFARRDGRWVMIHDQNTPLRRDPAGTT